MTTLGPGDNWARSPTPRPSLHGRERLHLSPRTTPRPGSAKGSAVIRAPIKLKVVETDDEICAEQSRPDAVHQRARLRPRPGHPIPGRANPLEAPESLEVAPIGGHSHAHPVSRLERIGFPVVRKPLGDGVLGHCRHGAHREIMLAPGQAPNGEAHTLIHELAHARGIRSAELGRERAEQVVEAVAHIACTQLGLDVSAASVPYIAGWGGDDADAVERDVALIDELAKWFAAELADTDTDAEPADDSSDAVGQLPVAA